MYVLLALYVQHIFIYLYILLFFFFNFIELRLIILQLAEKYISESERNATENPRDKIII